MKKLLTIVFLLTLIQNQAFAAFSCSVFFERLLNREITTQTWQQLQSYKNFLSKLSSTNPKELNPGFRDKWSCDSQGCMVFSSQLHYILRTNHFPTEKVVARSITGQHAFLVDRTNHENEILIDPTYKQFFRKNAVNEPDIFIGTRAQLIQLFQKYRKDLIPRTLEEINQELDAAEYAEYQYGFGRYTTDSHGNLTRTSLVE
jgi:hypothetical protein